MDRGADDTVDAIVRGRLDRKLATPRPQKRNELVWRRSDSRHLISQPTFEQFRVGDRRFAEAEQHPDLGPMALPSPTGRVVLVIITGLHAELLSYPRHSFGADFRRRLWKPSMCSMKQDQQCKSETVGDILRHDERLVLRRQRPRRDDVSVNQSHIRGSVRKGCVAKLLSFATPSSVQQNLASSCCKNLSRK